MVAVPPTKASCQVGFLIQAAVRMPRLLGLTPRFFS
jgi:hypothetical protein